MAEARRDQNKIPTLLGVSNVDGETPVVLWADPVTHRLLVDASAEGTGGIYQETVIVASKSVFDVSSKIDSLPELVEDFLVFTDGALISPDQYTRSGVQEVTLDEAVVQGTVVSVVVDGGGSVGGTSAFNDIVYINRDIPQGSFDEILTFEYPFAVYEIVGLDVILRLDTASVARSVTVNLVNTANPSTVYFTGTLAVGSTESNTFALSATATALPTVDTSVSITAGSSDGTNVDFIGFIEQGRLL